MALDETGNCACLSQNFEKNLKTRDSCICLAELSLLPDESDCVRTLAYATSDGKKFVCSEGLEYDNAARECVPKSGKTWLDVADVCAEAGRVVSLDGTECVTQCGILETETNHACTCV